MATMDSNIYFQLKAHISCEIGQNIYLEDVALLSCQPDMEEKVRKLIVLKEQDKGIKVISAIEVIELIREAIPGARVFSVGETRAFIHIGEKKAAPKSSFMGPFKVVLTWLLLFMGSGLAIMYFHADVNMHKVHETIYTAITGQRGTDLYWVNIPYSIGIGLGIALFFGIFPNRDRSMKPDPLEIGIYKYKKDIKGYLEAETGREREDG